LTEFDNYDMMYLYSKTINFQTLLLKKCQQQHHKIKSFEIKVDRIKRV